MSPEQIDEALRRSAELTAAIAEKELRQGVVAIAASHFVDATTDYDRKFSRDSLERAVADMRASESAYQAVAAQFGGVNL